MKIKSRKLDFEERDIANNLMRKITQNNLELEKLIFEYVYLKKDNIEQYNNDTKKDLIKIELTEREAKGLKYALDFQISIEDYKSWGRNLLDKLSNEMED